MCAERKIKLVFTSSEQVFDGSKGQYVEHDLPNPKNEYGKQKSEAEKILSEANPNAAIVRISVLFGKGNGLATCFLEQWIENWQRLLPVTTFHDEIRSFLGADTAATGLYHLLKKDASGIFHFGGADSVSRTDFALLVKQVFKLENAPMKSRSQKEVKLSAFRPPDLSLNCKKISDTGFVPKSALEELKSLKAEFNLSPPPFLN